MDVADLLVAFLEGREALRKVVGEAAHGVGVRRPLALVVADAQPQRLGLLRQLRARPIHLHQLALARLQATKSIISTSSWHPRQNSIKHLSAQIVGDLG